MKVEQSLTKENFWNEQMGKFPKSMKIFCAWIDEYKKAVNWNGLFRESHDRDNKGEIVGGTKKFHEIPYEMQAGIWIAFVKDLDKEFFEQSEYQYSFDLEEDIKMFFGEIEADIDEYENTETENLLAKIRRTR